MAKRQGKQPIAHKRENHGHPGVFVASECARHGGVGIIDDLIDSDNEQQVGGDAQHGFVFGVDADERVAKRHYDETDDDGVDQRDLKCGGRDLP